MDEHLKISFEELEQQHEAVLLDQRYGTNVDLLKNIIARYPTNDDIYEIAIKVSVVNLTSSTQLSQHSRILSLYDVSKIILDLEIDNDIQNGNPEVVNKIAAKCKEKGVNLFSFASKYCFYHNVYVYHRDDFSIFDSVVASHLHLCNPGNMARLPKEVYGWKNNIRYDLFNNYIGSLLDAYDIHHPARRQMFDHFLWNNFRNSNPNKLTK